MNEEIRYINYHITDGIYYNDQKTIKYLKKEINELQKHIKIMKEYLFHITLILNKLNVCKDAHKYILQYIY